MQLDLVTEVRGTRQALLPGHRQVEADIEADISRASVQPSAICRAVLNQTANPAMLHPLGIRRGQQGWNSLLETQVECPCPFEMDLAHIGVEITRRAVELLSFALVKVCPEHVSVGSMELGIDIQDRLNVVVSRRQCAEAG